MATAGPIKPPDWVTQSHVQRQAALKPVATVQVQDRLKKGQSLIRGGRISSKNRQYFLTLQTDGNLVLYKAVNNYALWASNNRGDKAVMQTDGNFVLYSGTKPVWATNNRGEYIVVQNDGNLVLYDANNKPAWNSGTWGGVKSGSHDSKSIFEKFANTIGQGVSTLAKSTGSIAKSAGKIFKDVTQSSIWKVAAGAAIFVPGIGTALSAGMVAAAAIGKATSVKDAIISTARSQLPGGEVAKLGFDVATSTIVHGKNLDSTALKFMRDQLPSEGKVGFDTAFAMHAGRLTNKPAPSSLPLAAKAAFYTAKGGIKLNAPADMRKMTLLAATQHLAAHLGIKAALDDFKKLEGIELFERLQLIAIGVELGDNSAIDTKRAILDTAKTGDKKAVLMQQMLEKVELANKLEPPIKLYRTTLSKIVSKFN